MHDDRRRCAAPDGRDAAFEVRVVDRVDAVRFGDVTLADGEEARQPGLRGDWHVNVRPSNTEPLLRLNLEGRTVALMEQKRDEVLALIRG